MICAATTNRLTTNQPPLLSLEQKITPFKREPRIYARGEHAISRKAISPSALKVLYRLHNAGFRACLVGGCVRDLLLGQEPKDFDVATNAQPEQVRELFRNCRLIGRRFRLAHVRFGREIIEVATFRASHDAGGGGAVANENGRIVRDNVYGEIDDDVWRRDFTVNALYYDISDFSVVDYVGGFDDLEHGILRLLGDPELRFREDPVRMIRAMRFAVKPGLDIDTNTAAPIRKLGHLLQEIAPARLFDETLKLFHNGCSLPNFELLREFGLLEELFPLAEEHLKNQAQPLSETLIGRALASTDMRISAGKTVTPAFLIAAFLWDAVDDARRDLEASDVSATEAISLAADRVISQQIVRLAIPRRLTQATREIWSLQQGFDKRTAKRAGKLVEHPRFRAAYDFLQLRAEAGEGVGELAQWWTRYQEADDAERKQMVGPLKRRSSARRGKRRRRSS